MINPYELVLLRHGESYWNRENRYTGWVDIDLTQEGICEAYMAAEILSKEDQIPDMVFTSYLKRAIRTTWLVLDNLDRMWVNIKSRWRLNERHYGALQGKRKDFSADEYGVEKVILWRRSLYVKPPQLLIDDDQHPRYDVRYLNVDEEVLPSGESLHDTILRLLPCWQSEIVPELKQGKRVMIVAHGNSLRALLIHILDIPEEDVPNLVIPTGSPLKMQFDESMKLIDYHYLGNNHKLEQAKELLRSQGMIQ